MGASMTGPIATDKPPVVHLALIDDEPLITERLLHRAEATLGPDVAPYVYRRPRRLGSNPPRAPLTHAVVDLSFGDRDLDSLDIRDEPETGVDAIDRLLSLHPDCRIVVATRRDTPLIVEMTIAIRQTWPTIMFLHKSDERLLDRFDEFLRSGTTHDNAEFALDLLGVAPIPPHEIRQALKATLYPSTSASILLELAKFTRRPTIKELAAQCHYADQYVRKLLQEAGDGLYAAGLLPERKFGVERLWPWARSRRAILQRVLSAE